MHPVCGSRWQWLLVKPCNAFAGSTELLTLLLTYGRGEGKVTNPGTERELRGCVASWRKLQAHQSILSGTPVKCSRCTPSWAESNTPEPQGAPQLFLTSSSAWGCHDFGFFHKNKLKKDKSVFLRIYLYFDVCILMSIIHILQVAFRDSQSVLNVCSPGKSFWCFYLNACKQLYIHESSL